MLDLSEYPDANILDESALQSYQAMHHWVFETSLNYAIEPYLLLSPLGLPGQSTDSAGRYIHDCTRQLVTTYPELSGIFLDFGKKVGEAQTDMVQRAIVDTIDAVRPDAKLFLRGPLGQHRSLVGKVTRRANRPISYSVSYSRDYLVDASPDPEFNNWVEAAGAGSVSAELWISNFEPWTSFSFETASELIGRLQEMGCKGFSLQPLAPQDWPRSSDTFFRYQWQRDLVWYSIWGGKNTADLVHAGQPKWLLRNSKLLPASRRDRVFSNFCRFIFPATSSVGGARSSAR